MKMANLLKIQKKNKFNFMKTNIMPFSVGKINVNDVDEDYDKFFDKRNTEEYKKKVEEHYKRIECKIKLLSEEKRIFE